MSNTIIDEPSEQAPGKRERLVASAIELFHHQGVERTTLAEVAIAADVPVGNVYYYFKTKDELVEATIAAHAHHIEISLDSLDRYRTPKGRLHTLVRIMAEQRDIAAQFGCPHGTLTAELDKRNGGIAQSVARLMELPLDWAEAQFAAMGRSDAGELALALIASYQGMSLLTNAFRDPELMRRESRRLERWIDSLAKAPQASR